MMRVLVIMGIGLGGAAQSNDPSDSIKRGIRLLQSLRPPSVEEGGG